MSNIKALALELLQDIPDEKIPSIIEILKGLRLLYCINQDSAIHEAAPQTAMGIFNNYADAKLIPMEKDAWGEAVKEKYVAN